VEVLVEPGMFHVWPLIEMPEARRARDRIVAFLSDFGKAQSGVVAELKATLSGPRPFAPGNVTASNLPKSAHKVQRNHDFHADPIAVKLRI
jgi:hypothetical protein